MHKRSFLALAGVAFVLLVAAIVATANGEHAATRAPPGERAFPALAARLGDVVSVGFRDKSGRRDFVRVGERWLAVEKGDYPAAADRIRRIALALADLTLIEPKTREPKLYSRLEVEDPGQGKSTLVTLKDRSGATLAALIVGKRRYDRLGEGLDGVYVRRPGRAQSWLATGALDLSGDMASWLDRAILDIPAERIAKIILSQPNGKALVLGRAAPNGRFAVEGAPAGTRFADDTTVGAPAVALASLALDDVAPAAKNPIPGQGVVTAHYRTFDGLAVDLRMIERGKTAWVAIDATGSGKTAAEAQAIERRVGPWIYAIPSYKADLLKTTLDRLVAPAKS